MNQEGGLSVQMFNPNHCSPEQEGKKGSCLDDDMIKEIAKILNALRSKNEKIEEIDCSMDCHKIHGCICENIKRISGCNSEACLLTIKEVMDKLGSKREEFKDSFKPLMPQSWIKDYNTWLTTTEIEESIQQHEKDDKSFYFYGAVPIDFSDCSVSDLCSIDVRKHRKKGVKKIGIVFNTDPHDAPGKHWISMYIDLLGSSLNGIPGIYYFDSFGRKPPDEIHALVQKVIKQGGEKTPFKYFYNDDAIQKKDNQCGMYSIHFIKEMLKGVPFKEIINKRPTDEDMKEARNIYFINEEEIK